MLCEALGAEGIACVGTKFVIWRKSEKLAQEKKKAARRMKKIPLYFGFIFVRYTIFLIT